MMCRKKLHLEQIMGGTNDVQNKLCMLDKLRVGQMMYGTNNALDK